MRHRRDDKFSDPYVDTRQGSDNKQYTYSMYTESVTPQAHSELVSERDQKHSAKALLPPLPKRNYEKERADPRSAYQNTTISNEDEKSPQRIYTPQMTQELRQNEGLSTAMFAKQ